MLINVTYDASVSRAPAGFKSVINSVVQFFDSTFTNPVTINIDVGYGEIGGRPLSAGALVQSLYYLDNFTYGQIRAALTAHATSAADLTAVASLPAASPVSGNFWVAQAQAKALGLIGNGAGVDGYIGFATGNVFDFNNTNGVTAGLYDFFGVVAHEISEVMGRFLQVGQSVGSLSKGYSLLDLFHYSSAGHRDFSSSQAGYFSVDGGITNLGNFNTNASGDFGDWAGSVGNNAFRAFSAPGVVNAITAADLRELDVLGWNRSATSAATKAGTSGATPSGTASAGGAGQPLHTVLVGYSDSDESSGFGGHATTRSVGSDERSFVVERSATDLDHGGPFDLVMLIGHAHSPASDFLVG